MTTILTFDQSRCRKANPAATASTSAGSSAQVLLFTGIRREPLLPERRRTDLVPYEPMFDDTAPEKPTGRKRRRGKNG